MKVGEIVIHPNMPELGVGVILEMSQGSQQESIAYTRWDSAPAKKFQASFLQLAPAGTPTPEKFLQPFNESINQRECFSAVLFRNDVRERARNCQRWPQRYEMAQKGCEWKKCERAV